MHTDQTILKENKRLIFFHFFRTMSFHVIVHSLFSLQKLLCIKSFIQWVIVSMLQPIRFNEVIDHSYPVTVG